MEKETLREFASRSYTKFDTGEHSKDKDIAKLTVNNNEMNNSLVETRKSCGYQSFQGNIIIDEKVPMAFNNPFQ